MKPANFVHVAGFCISCGIVAYYLTRPAPAYYDPQAQARADALARLTQFDLFSDLQFNARDDIWNAAQAYDRQGQSGGALGCYQRFLMLYPDDPAATQARERIVELESATVPARQE